MSVPIGLDRAVEVFVQAFAQGKSRTYPYVASRIGDLWVMQDGPGKKGDARKVEVVGVSVEPEIVVRTLESAGIKWHFYCDIAPPGTDLAARKMAFKSLDYRALSTEWMFAHDLGSIPDFVSRPPVRLAATREEFDAVPQRTSHARPWFGFGRQYTVAHPTRAVGFVRSVPFQQDAWVSDLFVHAEYRGQGYGRALMAKLLKDDKESGVRASVLLASRAGARLYPHVGYQQIGVLQMFCPTRRREPSTNNFDPGS